MEEEEWERSPNSKHPYRGNRCTAHSKRHGERCKQYAIPGGNVCHWHGGANPVAQVAARRRLREHEAIKKLKKLGYPIKTDPQQALLQQVNEAAGNVAFLRKQVQELGDEIIIDGDAHVYIRMYNEERDRLARLAKMALDAGIAERQVLLAEKQGALVAAAIVGVLDNARLNLTFEQRQLGRKLAAESMRLIESFDEDDPVDEVEGIVKELPYRPPRFGETRKPGPEAS